MLHGTTVEDDTFAPPLAPEPGNGSFLNNLTPKASYA